MSDDDLLSPKDEPLELDRPAAPQRTVSNPAMQAVRSAARMEPLADAPRALTKDRLKEGAIDTVLNSVSILGEVIEDFRTSDRFFKYKAMVLSLWFLLMIGSFGVACPSTGPSNDIDAALVIVAGDPGRPIYLIKNESQDVWRDVQILVNGGKYRATLSQLAAHGGNTTLSSAVLFDEAGTRAPNTLVIQDIVVDVQDPEAQVTLLRNGQPVEEQP